MTARRAGRIPTLLVTAAAVAASFLVRTDATRADDTAARTTALQGSNDNAVVSRAAAARPGALLAEHGLAMVVVEPGAFWMGSPPDEPGHRDDERRHRVVIERPFAIGHTEVTAGLVAALVGGEAPAEPRLPVTGLDWRQVLTLCNTLSEREGLTRAYTFDDDGVRWDATADGYRLPTEAEWEYAARAGGADVYAGASARAEVCRHANVADRTTHASRAPRDRFPCDDGFPGLAPVGSLQPNAWGLFDMTGNVREWVWDWYAPYPDGEVVDPVGAGNGDSWIYRGGDWTSGWPMARIAYRSPLRPDLRGEWLGFRLARSLGGADQGAR